VIKKITGKMSINDVIEKYPETVDIFMKYGLSCVGCPFAMMESLEQGAKSHGINIKELLKDLNKSIGREKV